MAPLQALRKVQPAGERTEPPKLRLSQPLTDRADLRVEKYLPWIKKIAYSLVRRLPSDVYLEDLVSAGVIGFLEAAERWEPGGINFRSFVHYRVEGAMYDELRRMDPMAKDARIATKKLEKLDDAHYARTGVHLAEQELAEKASMDLGRLRELHRMARASSARSLEDFHKPPEATRGISGEEGSASPFHQVMTREIAERLDRAMGQLDARRRQVVELYYAGGLTLWKIGQILGVTESRACQLLKEAHTKLRESLGPAEEEKETPAALATTERPQVFPLAPLHRKLVGAIVVPTEQPGPRWMSATEIRKEYELPDMDIFYAVVLAPVSPAQKMSRGSGYSGGWAYLVTPELHEKLRNWEQHLIKPAKELPTMIHTPNAIPTRSKVMPDPSLQVSASSPSPAPRPEEAKPLNDSFQGSHNMAWPQIQLVYGIPDEDTFVQVCKGLGIKLFWYQSYIITPGLDKELRDWQSYATGAKRRMTAKEIREKYNLPDEEVLQSQGFRANFSVIFRALGIKTKKGLTRYVITPELDRKLRNWEAILASAA